MLIIIDWLCYLFLVQQFSILNAFTEANMVAFCDKYKFETYKKPSCMKNYTSLSSIDLHRKTVQKVFNVLLTIKTGLSDFS